VGCAKHRADRAALRPARRGVTELRSGSGYRAHISAVPFRAGRAATAARKAPIAARWSGLGLSPGAGR